MLGMLITLATNLASADLTKKLEGYWSFDGSLGDPIGNNYGRFGGNTRPEYVEGKFGQAVRLNGIDQFIELVGAEPTAFQNSAAFALSAWIQIDDDSGTIFWKGHLNWHLNYDAPGIFSSWGQSFGGDAISAFEQSDNQWHHVVLTVDNPNGSGERLLYIDGELIASGGDPWTFYDARPLTIGLRQETEPHAFRGTIDELAIWKRNLTPLEVVILWNNGRGRRIPTLFPDSDSNGLIDHWEEMVVLPPGSADDDTDGDGLSNLEEFQRGLFPRVPDSDGDDRDDRDESDTGIWISETDTGTSPHLWDSDADGLSDGEENPIDSVTPTNPNIWDSDGDGFSDGDETQLGTNPSDFESKPNIGFGLQAYWPFDGNLEDRLSGNHGVWGPDGSEPVYQSGIADQALLLNGEQYVDIDRAPSAFGFLDSSFSVACWVLLDKPGGTALPWTSNFLITCGSGRRWHLATQVSRSVTRNGIDFYVPRKGGKDGALLQKKEAAVFMLGNTKDLRFHHIAAVYQSLPGGYTANQRTVRIYLDGEPLSYGLGNSEAYLIPGDPEGLRIGNYHSFNPLAVTFRGWSGLMDDVAIWNRALNASEVKLLYAAGSESGRGLETLLDRDSDADRLPDKWEEEMGLNPAEPDADQDPDGDGLSNLEEFHLGTKPNAIDSDNDGLEDNVETKTGFWVDEQDTGTNPILSDTDRDGLADGRENLSKGVSDPNLMDTDGDEISDFDEWLYQSNAISSDSHPILSAGLIGYWPLDEDFNDYRSLRYHGVARGDSPIEFVETSLGKGILLNGVDQYVEIEGGSEEVFDFSGESFTVSVWYRSDYREVSIADCIEINGDSAISFCFYEPALISKARDGWGVFAFAILDTAYLRFQGNSNWFGFRYPLTKEGEFHHTVGVVDVTANEIRWYNNGKQFAVGSNSGLAAPTVTSFPDRLKFGSYSIGPFAEVLTQWQGVIDEVAIWKRALGTAEVQSIWASGASGIPLADMIEGEPGVNIDTDNDGVSDLAERLAGTDSDDPSDHFRIVSINRFLDTIQIEWTSIVKRRYQIEIWNSFSSSWTPVGDRESGSTGTTKRRLDLTGRLDWDEAAMFRVRVILD